MSKGFDAVYASDDLLDEKDDPRYWFQVDADRDPPSSHPIAGFGIALGTDPNGYECNVSISAETLAKRITFTQRKFRGFMGPKVVGNTIVIDVAAPIIDGTEEKPR